MKHFDVPAPVFPLAAAVFAQGFALGLNIIAAFAASWTVLGIALALLATGVLVEQHRIDLYERVQSFAVKYVRENFVGSFLVTVSCGWLFWYYREDRV